MKSHDQQHGQARVDPAYGHLREESGEHNSSGGDHAPERCEREGCLSGGDAAFACELGSTPVGAQRLGDCRKTRQAVRYRGPPDRPARALPQGRRLLPSGCRESSRPAPRPTPYQSAPRPRLRNSGRRGRRQCSNRAWEKNSPSRPSDQPIPASPGGYLRT